jgi:hypothetical protein
LLSPLPSRKASSKTANAAYIKKALAKSLAIFKPKSPRLLFQDWFLSWVDSPSRLCHLCPKVPGDKKHQDDPHPPYSLDITPTNFFLFPRVKSELFGLSLSHDSFKTSWVGVLQTIAKDEFAKHILAVV